jgi:hypothetical protein
MVIEFVFINPLLASVVGLILSVMIERLMTPPPALIRPWAAWSLHVGLWMSSHAVLSLVVGRPWFAAAIVLAFLLVLVLVNNAKVKALREPFVFQDYEYFTDAIRHPRLYIPFLGWWKFLGSAIGVVLAVAIGLWGETAPDHPWAVAGQAGGVGLIFTLGLLLIVVGHRQPLQLRFKPEHDIRTMGLLASLWQYGREERAPFTVAAPFDLRAPKKPVSQLPDLVAVQSESFFDPRTLVSLIRPEVLAAFDRLKGDALACGELDVPAWGANTVRSEFAFLTGIDEEKLGIHRFNPYRAVAAGWEVPSLASYLKQLGYYTVCIHPYPASFYRRDRVFPRLGFDAFVDISEFSESMRFGPYVGDTAVTEKMRFILQKAPSPVFVFAITMENHGPLHLEKVSPSELSELYGAPPPQACEDLSVYLRHLRNADHMIAQLRKTLEQRERPASMCWFGDHVPIMPAVYQSFGEPKGCVPYAYWHNQDQRPSHQQNLSANQLAMHWLRDAGLMNNG